MSQETLYALLFNPYGLTVVALAVSSTVGGALLLKSLLNRL